MSIFDFKEAEAIGRVFSVDTSSVTVKIEDEEQLRRLQVHHLVVLRTARAGRHLIGTIHRITRRALYNHDVSSGANVDGVENYVENLMWVTLVGTHFDAFGTKQNVFKRTLEAVPEIDAPCFVLEGMRLTAFMQAISTALKGKPALKVGTYMLGDDATALLDGNKFFQRHAVLVGSTGSGKSWTVASLLEQIASLPMANAIVFDIHGEYRPLAGDGIQLLRIAGPGDEAASLSDGVLHLPYWLLSYEEMLALLLDRSDQNAPNQAMIFAKTVIDAKEHSTSTAGETDLQGNFTVDSPIPYDINKVLQQLRDLDSEMVQGSGSRDRQGPFHGKLTRFIQRLEAKISDRRLTFLFGLPDEAMQFDWLSRACSKLLRGTALEKQGGVKIIDFSAVPSDILPLMLGLVARLIFDVQQWTITSLRHPVSIFCDEAHLYIPSGSLQSNVHAQSLQSFERIAKEGRKYGVGLVVISQRPAEVNHTVMSQCNNFMVMRLTNPQDQEVIRRLLPEALEGFVEALPVLDIGEAFVVGDASLLPSRIRMSIPKKKPDSATLDFWTLWSADSGGDYIDDAVFAMRKQVFVNA